MTGINNIEHALDILVSNLRDSEAGVAKMKGGGEGNNYVRDALAVIMEQRGLIADALTGQVRHFLAQACQYAQSHIDDPESWSADTSAREERLQVVSFQAACFLARHTRGGGEGVDWDVILKELVEHPMKTEAEWLGILHQKAELYGGWAMPAPSAESTLSP